jgi:surfeit locus 1 family protein
MGSSAAIRFENPAADCSVARVGPLMALRSRSVLAAGFILVAAICARLGVWQVSRLKERRTANAAALAARSAPAVRLNGQGLDRSAINRRVIVRGRYDHRHDIVLRGRGYGGTPGVEIVSPLLQPTGDTAVLVNRGFVPAPDAVTADPGKVQEPGPVQVEGVALALDSTGGAPLSRSGLMTWGRLDRNAIGKTLPYPVAPVYIRQTPDTALPSFPRRLEPPPLDDGPHLSYAIQWFAFTIIALVFAGVVTRMGRTGGRPG